MNNSEYMNLEKPILDILQSLPLGWGNDIKTLIATPRNIMTPAEIKAVDHVLSDEQLKIWKEANNLYEDKNLKDTQIKTWR